MRRVSAALPLAAFALAALASTTAGSGTCQRITPGQAMDGNGCGPGDSAVGDACNTADDCFFDGCRCEVVQLPCGSPPPPPPPPPRRPPVGPPAPAPCNLDEINLNCPAHGHASLVPDTCDGSRGKNCREVFTAWYDRCWAVKDVQTMLGLIPGAREQLVGFYQLCNGGGPAPPAASRCGDMTSRAATMNHECCDEPYEDCSSGLPAVCNTDCASVLLPFFADCSSDLGASADTYRAVVAQCQHPVSPPPDPCAAAPCLNGGVCVAGGKSGHRRTQAAVAAFTCSCTAGFSGVLCEPAPPPPPPPPLRMCSNREVCCSVGRQPASCNCACRSPYAGEGGRR